MDTRKIKIISSNIIENDNTEFILHPNTLELYNTFDKSTLLLTKNYILNKDLETMKKINNNREDLKKDLKKN